MNPVDTELKKLESYVFIHFSNVPSDIMDGYFTHINALKQAIIDERKKAKK